MGFISVLLFDIYTDYIDLYLSIKSLGMMVFCLIPFFLYDAHGLR